MVDTIVQILIGLGAGMGVGFGCFMWGFHVGSKNSDARHAEERNVRLEQLKEATAKVRHEDAKKIKDLETSLVGFKADLDQLPKFPNQQEIQLLLKKVHARWSDKFGS